MRFRLRTSAILVFLLFCVQLDFLAQASDSPTESKIKQLVDKKAEYHRLTNGQQDGYRIKIHFGIDKDKANAVRAKFMSRFNEYVTYEDYDQPNWVVLVGDFKTNLEAFESKKKIQNEFPNAFIVKCKIRVK